MGGGSGPAQEAVQSLSLLPALGHQPPTGRPWQPLCCADQAESVSKEPNVLDEDKGPQGPGVSR